MIQNVKCFFLAFVYYLKLVLECFLLIDERFFLFIKEEGNLLWLNGLYFTQYNAFYPGMSPSAFRRLCLSLWYQVIKQSATKIDSNEPMTSAIISPEDIGCETWGSAKEWISDISVIKENDLPIANYNTIISWENNANRSVKFKELTIDVVYSPTVLTFRCSNSTQ